MAESIFIALGLLVFGGGAVFWTLREAISTHIRRLEMAERHRLALARQARLEAQWREHDEECRRRGLPTHADIVRRIAENNAVAQIVTPPHNPGRRRLLPLD